MHNRKSLISVFQRLSAGVGEVFILVGGVGWPLGCDSMGFGYFLILPNFLGS